MTRKITKTLTSFTRPNLVTYTFDPTHSIVTITVPPNSSWTSGLHWHSSHTEYLQVTQGAATVTTDGETRNLIPGDGALRIDSGVRHEWRRAASEGRPEDAEDLVVREWTTPMDGQKEVFFRNLNSVLAEEKPAGYVGALWVMLQLCVIFWGLDNYPVFLSVGKQGGRLARTVEAAITEWVLLMAWVVGKMLGLRAVYEEYTPDELVRGGKRSV